ncbi:hypothetical protein GLOTRDRAFT_77669 [Gloeophyllum trabeum ATCC 11539]|uniref:Geranylgeranyl pyrophosphate synthetase n=1 Tax=Gloeophyllum trabeum (strain ATCC 11539 / FP-39264 / Madison 617) TaxID=670483 RepID=S7RKG5_GLOTA|nr:uncharacterized protein GLOTRDRAFT_77669 [Gloeophyllum trabeum ATCC 11539]EPQ54880.1 hypothetical protein GLOTRDRAFT_77669 [Gloeophyllum trabeum ATCC 11539]
MYRQRGGRYPLRASNTPTSAPTTPRRDYHEGLEATAVKVFSKPSAESFKEKIKIENLQYLASYNWVEAAKPTIIVPGSPPEWTDRPLPFMVQRDSGTVFVDQNGFRVPRAVLLPLFKSVDMVTEETGRPDFDWSSVDFVTDRNGLRKILRWVNGTADKTFRIDMQLVGKQTILLNRWEATTKEPARGSFGFGFENATTEPAPGCERSTGHHRIVTYACPSDMNGLKMVVRFEVDACLPPPREATKLSSATTLDDLTATLSGLGLGSRSKAPETTSDASGLDIIHAGSADIAQERIVELTTRSQRNADTFDWVDAYPQLFLSGTPHHFLGIHVGGKFSTIRKRRLGSPEMQRVEERAQPSLKKLRSILQVLHDLVIEHGETGRLSLICVKGILQVFKRNTTDSLLPDEFLTRFR